MIKGLGRSSSAHSKGSASRHSCNVINDVHPSKRDGGKLVSEGHKKWTGTQPRSQLVSSNAGPDSAFILRTFSSLTCLT